MSRGRAWIVSAALIFVVGCGSERGAREAEEPSAGPVPGGTCVIGLFSDLDGLNEFVSTDANATEVMTNLLYTPLFRWGADFELERALASAWEFSGDRREITVTLRDDVLWHDGVPTTAADVVFTFRMMKNPLLGYPDVGSLRPLEEVEAVGPHTVVFRFARAYADQLPALRRVILPHHLLGDVPAELMESASFNRAPIGNGPFRFVRWKRDRELVLEANPDHFAGRPWLDRIVVRVIPDQTAVETAFRSGELDIVERLRFSSVPGLREEDRYRVKTVPQRGFQFIGWNIQNPLFAESAVRRAMTMAINRQGILDALVFGQGKVTAHPIMSLSQAYATEIAPHPYDPTEASRILAELRWRDTDGDGVLDRDGQKFEFRIKTNLGNQLREDTLVMIQADLARIGIAATPEVREWTVFLDEIMAKDFDAYHMAWQSDFVVNPYDTFHSDAVLGKYNMGSYTNREVDALIDRGLLARTHADALPIWREFQRVLHQEQPYTVLFELNYSVGVSLRIRGVETDVRGFLLNAGEWWIAPGDRRYAS
ncbi:MAG: ABC transporter substrate-binding protein [Gemmatimonadota bacterium]|nr:ABC transporter substrate-binding protein [Gemmatimonadota bacterium]